MLLLNFGNLNRKIKSVSYFNTSYVVIKHWSGLRYYSTLGRISIHLMLLLNPLKCVEIKKKSHFNTSYVVIKHKLYSNGWCHNDDFNTSYVVIKPVIKTLLMGVFLFQYILCCY